MQWPNLELISVLGDLLPYTKGIGKLANQGIENGGGAWVKKYVSSDLFFDKIIYCERPNVLPPKYGHVQFYLLTQIT